MDLSSTQWVQVQPTTVESASTATTSLSDFDDFLNLFVAQLQNQDPLEPMDQTEFLAQTAQFSMVEQLLALNESVSSLTAMAESELYSPSTVSSLLGCTVTGQWMDSDGAVQTVAGPVTGIEYSSSGEPMLVLEDQTAMPLSAVVSIDQTST